MNTESAMLDATGVNTYYGDSHLLQGVDLAIPAGRALGLLGRNGMGKTTLIRSLMGYVPMAAGKVKWGGRDVSGWPPEKMARLGIGYVPEGRGIFPNLSVRENLVMSARAGVDGRREWTYDRVLALFPRLAERLDNGGGQLSGGEQQMLSIGRALMARPKLLLLDEPSLGLAPLIVKQIFDAIKVLNKEQGLTVFLVEQNAFAALKLSDRGYVMVNGRVTMSGSGKELLANPEVRAAYLEGGRH